MNQQTNHHQPTTDDLLARFAAVAERLKGTGAPAAPDYIFYCAESEWWKIQGQPPGREDEFYCDPAALAGYVMWAMEVIRWHYGEEIRVWTRPKHILTDLESIEWIQEKME